MQFILISNFCKCLHVHQIFTCTSNIFAGNLRIYSKHLMENFSSLNNVCVSIQSPMEVGSIDVGSWTTTQKLTGLGNSVYAINSWNMMKEIVSTGCTVSNYALMFCSWYCHLRLFCWSIFLDLLIIPWDHSWWSCIILFLLFQFIAGITDVLSWRDLPSLLIRNLTLPQRKSAPISRILAPGITGANFSPYCLRILHRRKKWCFKVYEIWLDPPLEFTFPCILVHACFFFLNAHIFYLQSLSWFRTPSLLILLIKVLGFIISGF